MELENIVANTVLLKAQEGDVNTTTTVNCAACFISSPYTIFIKA
jgi:hypothetical protein